MLYEVCSRAIAVASAERLFFVVTSDIEKASSSQDVGITGKPVVRQLGHLLSIVPTHNTRDVTRHREHKPHRLNSWFSTPARPIFLLQSSNNVAQILIYQGICLNG